MLFSICNADAEMMGRRYRRVAYPPPAEWKRRESLGASLGVQNTCNIISTKRKLQTFPAGEQFLPLVSSRLDDDVWRHRSVVEQAQDIEIFRTRKSKPKRCSYERDLSLVLTLKQKPDQFVIKCALLTPRWYVSMVPVL